VFSAQNQFPGNSDAYLALVKARQDRINELLGKFFGSSKSKADYDGAVEITPATAQPDRAPEQIDAVLFGVGRDGACAPKTGTSVGYTIRYLSAAPSSACTAAKIVKLTLKTRVTNSEKSVSQMVQLSMNSDKKDRGLAYRIPAPYTAKLFLGDEEQTEQDVAIAQLGYVAHLPEKFGGDSTLDFTLDSATGALLQISLNGKPKLLTDLPGQLSTLGGGALDVLAAYQKAHPDAASPDPLAQATGARKLAQEQLRLLLIQQCIAQPDRPECPTLVTQP
jgi:hypothetical protein